MAHAHSVKTHVGVAADWSRNLEIALTAGCARRQGNQRVHAAAVGGQLRNLLTGDQVADFASVRLNSNGSCFDRDLLLSAADLKLEVDAGTVVHSEHDIALFGSFESGGGCLHGVVADAKGGNYVLAIAAGSKGAGQACICVGNSDANVGNGRA